MNNSDLQSFIRNEVMRHLQIILFGEAGSTQESTETEPSEVIDNMYGNVMPSIDARPVAHPYGLVSRAPQGTVSVVAQVGEHPGNKLIIGHRDADRDTVKEGEVTLYDANGNSLKLQDAAVELVDQFGNSLKMESGTVTMDFADSDVILKSSTTKIGSDGADQPLMLGNVTKGVLSALMQNVADMNTELTTQATALAAHNHPTAAPGPPSPPSNAPVYAAAAVLFTTYGTSVSTSKATDVDSGNIISDAHFTEKG